MGKKLTKNYSVSIGILNGGATFESVDSDSAYNAYQAFLRGDERICMLVDNQGQPAMGCVAYKDINWLEVTTTTQEESFEDTTCGGSGGDDDGALFKGTINTTQSGSQPYCSGGVEYHLDALPTEITVVFDGVKYENMLPALSTDTNVTFGGSPYGEMPFDPYGFYVYFGLDGDDSYVGIGVPTSACGEHQITVYDLSA